jgi:hypothetical protein
MPVKENQPALFEAIHLWFEKPLALRGLDKRQASQTNKGHGRIETRTLLATTELTRYLDWPGLQQVLRLERRWFQVKTGLLTVEIRYGITSLSPHQADAPQLLRLWRQHWSIENNLHWSRDVIFGEDNAKLWRDNAPSVLATFRNLVISALHLFGYTSILAAREYCAAHPNHGFDLLHRSVSDWFV